MSTLDTLEKFTQAWPQAEREELARSFAIGWTALRYQGTGSMEGLEFLYPFLNDSDMRVRRHALQAVGTIFRGTGTESLEKLAYITLNRDLFIRDRAAPIIGQTLVGEGRDTILEVLRPSYTHRNDFVRGQGCTALGIAAQGQGGKIYYRSWPNVSLIDRPMYRVRPCMAWVWPLLGRAIWTRLIYWPH